MNSDHSQSFQKKKSLGQHFLRSRDILEVMCTAGEVTAADTVVEIGPGEGTLTELILEKGATVIALEKDRRLIPLLQETFAEAIANKKLILKEVDVLDFDPAEISHPYKIIANIPYYITGAILEKFLSAEHQPSDMVLLMQKEVGRRIVVRDSKESLLSISVKAYGKPEYVKTVLRGSFSPPPNVDSAIVAIKNISKKNFKNTGAEKLFFMLVKAGFAHKRKTLKNNLSEVAIEHGTAAEILLKKAGIAEQTRAEDLSLEQWHTLETTLRD